MRDHAHKIPASGPQREALRQKGQFWTPAWVADAMVGYVVMGGHDSVFDPAVGAGAFFRAAKAIAAEAGTTLRLLGTEVDPDALQRAREDGLSDSDLALVEVRDFVLRPPRGPFKAIVANPPYIRHHRLPADVKGRLAALGAELIGKRLDGRAGLHVYFLLRALQLLDKEGRLAFIMPADTCEGVFSGALWDWIARKYRLDAVVTFEPDASPFPRVDTNPIIFMLRNAPPTKVFLWARCTDAETNELKSWTLSGLRRKPRSGIEVYRRRLSEGLSTGLSRPPVQHPRPGPSLAAFASVLRGIATGANEFFLLTHRRATALRIPREFLIPAISRTRDAPGDRITPAALEALEARGRPTLLFCPDGRPIGRFPEPVRQYLKRGEAMGLHARPLIATRSPWYKMEVREVPPILFAYLGRRNARFIRNLAGVVPLTGFLCVYPRRQDADFVDKLWRVLRDPRTVANLALVGKSYGAGAIKVEPRALERLRLPETVLSEVGLQRARKAEQIPLPYPE